MSKRGDLLKDLKEALLGREKLKVSALRFLLSEIKNQEIEKRQELDDEEIILVIRQQVKKQEEAVALFEKGGRSDLVEKGRIEIELMSKYLPQQLPNQMVSKIVQEVIQSLPEPERKNFGKIMGLLMEKAKGQVDGKTASEAVKKYLSA